MSATASQTVELVAPRPRSPLGVYLLLWVTAGFYWLYWLHRMMIEMNEANGREVFAVRRVFWGGSAMMILYYAIFAVLSFDLSTDARPPFFVFPSLIVIGLGWIGGLLLLHVRISRALNSLAGSRKEFHTSTRATIALFFCYFGVLSYLQSRWNKIQTLRAKQDFA
jgi:hypothetical protein